MTFAFVLVSAFVVTSAAADPATSAETARPNVILILADDLGYETICANGGTSYKTPSLDRLAAGGVRFERCYVQPLCTPTRVQIMTGAYNVRNYITFGFMNPKLTTFAHLFRDAGYATGIVGKWQLGVEPDLPHRFGFDDYVLWHHLRRPPRYANPGLDIQGKPEDFRNGEYGPDLLETHAEEFLERHKDKPFLLYYPMTLTHGPYQPTPDSPDWDPKAIGEKVNQAPEHFGEMVEYMDKLIGRLVAKVDALGLRTNTLILFVGDNGTGRGARSKLGNRVVVGGKGTTTEGGMRVPLIASWPAGAASGKVCGDLVDSTDFLPTICEAAGIAIPPSMTVDGRSFLPQVKGEMGNPREWIYSWYSPHGEPPKEFAFDQHFKLYRTGEFFDLARDPTERNPMRIESLNGEAASAAKKLQAALDKYRDARPESLKDSSETKVRRKRAARGDKTRHAAEE